MSRNRVPRPRGGRNSGKHAEIDVFNPTPGTPICRGSELHLWSELLPLIMKLCSLGLAQEKAPRAEENVYAFPWKPLRTVSKRSGGGGNKTRNRVLCPRGGRNSGKHAEMDVFNPTPGTPICQGSELHLWSELLPLIVKLYSLGLAQEYHSYSTKSKKV